MATWSNKNRGSSSWTGQLRRGRDPQIADIADLTFNDPLLSDGTLVKDTTFEQLQDQEWTEENKNSASWSNETRN